MTQEEKELLLKELSSRLPYGVKALVLGWDNEKQEEVYVPLKVYSVNADGYVHFEYNNYDVEYCDVQECLLYLRPMASMTEEERNEYLTIKMQETERVALSEVYRPEAISEIMDWLNKHHFDYRGLIYRGLASEAPEGMYEYK